MEMTNFGFLQLSKKHFLQGENPKLVIFILEASQTIKPLLNYFFHFFNYFEFSLKKSPIILGKTSNTTPLYFYEAY